MSDSNTAADVEQITVRQALPRDVRAIADLTAPLAQQRVLVKKRLIEYFEDVQEFLVAENSDGDIVGCGALHVMWDDIAEVRTLAVSPSIRARGVGSRILRGLISRARQMELARLFCLTFEVDFFARHGFREISGTPVGIDVYARMLATRDEGVREFLDLAAVKPNTLGNTRMLLEIELIDEA
ncbi:MAG: amino-acid N-acetyltransferase [Actinomycetaceae bacterium]|nr:amino-acid N-acetyltransferase [Actinomycetaceae bacterium]